MGNFFSSEDLQKCTVFHFWKTLIGFSKSAYLLTHSHRLQGDPLANFEVLS